MDCPKNVIFRGQTKKKKMCGSGDPTYPIVWSPTLKRFIEKSMPSFSNIFYQVPGLLYFVYDILYIIILRLKMSYEFQVMHNNSHYICLYSLYDLTCTSTMPLRYCFPNKIIKTRICFLREN